MLFLLQPVFRCPEKGLLGDVYSPPDNDRSHDVQVSQVQEKNDVQNPKIEEKIKKTLIFQLDDPLPPDRNVGPNRPRLRRPPARVGQDVPVNTLLQIHALSQIQIQIPDMEFVKNFTHPDFQAKSFTPQKCVICDSFFRKLTA